MATKSENEAVKDILEYDRKRDFSKTREPKGGVSGKGGRQFVIQKHDASRLHFDLRLEMEGILRSWAVPKGPSLDPSEKRLAVHVEDHPVDYGSFEGTIPKGEYGGGTVMLWDRGSYECEGDPVEAFEKGEMKVTFHGERMNGKWALIQMKKRDDGENWLLIREKAAGGLDEGAEDLSERFVLSVDSGRSMEEIAEGAPVREVEEIEVKGAKKGDQPEFLKPQLAKLVDRVPVGERWLHEIKFDGYRILAFVESGKVRLVSRNDNDYTEQFRSVADSVEALGLSDGVIDGEVVVLNEDGVSDFGLLQKYVKEGQKRALTYFAFDLLFLEGQDLRGVGLEKRKEALHQLVEGSEVRYSDHIWGRGKEFYGQACQTGLEGIISKRGDSIYEGRRGANWVKVKCKQRQEFAIGGYTEPGGTREHFGALALGYYEDGKLVYCGRVGTGFDSDDLERVFGELQKIGRKTSPFDVPPEGSEKRGLHYVTPKLVAEVEFSSWTGDGKVRHASFQGLRGDKAAEDVVREEAVSVKKVEEEEMAEKSSKSRGDHVVAGVTITHPERVVFDEVGLTKIEVAEFYDDISEHVLAHVAKRPLALVRCPEGRSDECFFQKNYSKSLPEGLKPIELDEDMTGIWIEDEKGLIGLVQFGVLEIHPWGCTVDDVEHPDRLVFDLDPGPGLGWDEVVQGARDCRDLLNQIGLESWVKTSGGKGLHVCVPIKPEVEWDAAKAFCRGVAEILEQQNPDRYVAEMSKAKRKGKIFVDYLRNGRGATSVAAFSTRARAGAPVSVPVGWEEIGRLEGAGVYSVGNLRRRLGSLKSDPWEGFLENRQSLKKVLDSVKG